LFAAVAWVSQAIAENQSQAVAENWSQVIA